MVSEKIKHLAREIDKKRFQQDYIWLKLEMENEKIGKTLKEINKNLKEIMADCGYNLIHKNIKYYDE